MFKKQNLAPAERVVVAISRRLPRARARPRAMQGRSSRSRRRAGTRSGPARTWWTRRVRSCPGEVEMDVDGFSETYTLSGSIIGTQNIFLLAIREANPSERE